MSILRKLFAWCSLALLLGALWFGIRHYSGSWLLPWLIPGAMLAFLLMALVLSSMNDQSKGIAAARLAQVRKAEGRCPSCGYDRRGLSPSVACPECGRAPPAPLGRASPGAGDPGVSRTPRPG
ncbi:MAG TPA: hypothetical protein VD997_15250 [Phycisphaerales bacterium]|nr:hypothetical protein [Phycisphaerales bacterium]